MDALLGRIDAFASAPPRTWTGFAERCAAAVSGALQQWRGTSLLALGDSFCEQGDTGKSAQVVRRLHSLNPALRVRSHCGPSLGLLDAARSARPFGRRSFDAALVFIGPSQLDCLESQENFEEAAESALTGIARVARQSFLVTAFDVRTLDAPESGIAARRRRWFERTLQALCVRHGIAWVPLVEEEGCVGNAQTASFNFSVDGFRPRRDSHEMWTARMLEQPALAQLVFH